MTFNYQNANIHYNVRGKGPAVILLHGFLESATMWNPLIPLIVDKHTVITIDFPGLGKSEPIAEVHTMTMMAEVVDALLQKLNIDKATLIGHSMGGYITLAFIELFEEKVAKIILLNSTSKADSSERKAIRDRSIQLMEKRPKAFISMAIGNWAVEDSREKFKEDLDFLKNQAYTFPVEGIIAALRGMRNRKDRTEVLSKFPRPKYLLLAEDDPIIAAKETGKLAQQAGVEVKIISGGHMSMIENQSALISFVQSALAH